ncbi:hypothetical protein GCM10017778_08440 [Streptomyces vinaceus]|nr:hypothetical protein GCM10017778_08440 [Streptomyces vinaceus]
MLRRNLGLYGLGGIDVIKRVRGWSRVPVHGGERTVRLTPTEWHLLEILIAHPGRLITQSRLLLEVWVPSYGENTNYLRVYMAQLRRKLEADPSHPRYLITEPGRGYRFEP